MLRMGMLAEDPHLHSPEILNAIRQAGYEVDTMDNCRQWDEATLIGRLQTVDAAITGRKSPKIPNAMIGNFGRFKWLCHLHGTIRHLVEKPVVEAGLVVTNWGDAVSGVAEGAMTLLLACLKQLSELDHFTRTHEDRRLFQAFPCTLKGLDVGLYGFGPIGRHMARMAQAFGAKVAIYDPFARDIPPDIRVCGSLRELFSSCAVVSIHCGLNDATRGSVTRELLELLPEGGVLVNTARGAIVNEQDLADVLNAGRLWAGIDVIADEHGGDAWERTPLAQTPRTILAKHKIGSGKGYPPGFAPTPKLPDFAVENLRRFAAGEGLINVISADIYDLKT